MTDTAGLAGQRVALVTGGNRGLGREIARQLASGGIHVVIGSKNPEHGQQTATELRNQGLPATSVALDVTAANGAESAVTTVLTRLPRIDVLVNNAGVTDGAQRPSTVTLETVIDVLEVNLLGAWRCAAAAVPRMRSQGYGRIVNVSSRLASLTTMTDYEEPAYRVSKTAMNALTRVLAAELRGTGILVNAASPGWVRTRMGGADAPSDVVEGADTPVWLATLPDDGPTGGFFSNRRPVQW